MMLVFFINSPTKHIDINLSILGVHNFFLPLYKTDFYG